MALIIEELKIVNIGDLLVRSEDEQLGKLNLPDYQRPYRWKTKSANQLFMDIYEAFKKQRQEYRLGSVILHKEDEIYNIVDGQQRLTTLTILLYIINDIYADKLDLLEAEYDDLSNDSIVKNFDLLSKRVKELESNERDLLEEYILDKCTLVQIVTDNIQEAFQFFDSQNSRGKELQPHDLLKSYHLREMESDSEEIKINLVQKWENLKQDRLSDLFENYLYPILQWQRDLDGIDYSSNTTDVFKGISIRSTFNYAIYHKASNLFIEQFNRDNNNELFTSKPLSQFQLTEPIIAGRRFFEYILYYENLLKQVQDKIKRMHEEGYKEIPDELIGDIYTKRLYETVTLFFIDRFGEKALTMGIQNTLYSWTYSIRLEMQAVSMRTINKYARGNHQLNNGINLFKTISQMIDPEELKLINLTKPSTKANDEKNKYQEIKDKIFKINNWE